MRYLTQKEVIKLAEAQNKLTDEFKIRLDKNYPRYRLQIISEKEFYMLLGL